MMEERLIFFHNYSVRDIIIIINVKIKMKVVNQALNLNIEFLY